MMSYEGFASVAAVVMLMGCATDRGSMRDAESSWSMDRLLAGERVGSRSFDERQKRPFGGLHDDPASSGDFLESGDRHRAHGDFERAHMAYLRAHLADQENLVPLERIAYLVLRNDSERALLLFRELEEEAPESSSLQVGLAYSQIAEGDLGTARATLERALSLAPDSAAAHAALAIVRDGSRDHDMARSSYERLVESGSQDQKLLNNLAMSKLLSGEREEAVALLEKARNLDPRNRLVANNLGLALGLEGYDRAAFDAFRRHGSVGDALNNLGFTRYLRGDYAGARGLFEEALLSNETDELRVLRNLERVEAAELSSHRTQAP